jgi:basic membrane lipoprotein Med (substrate-binding protein (PBP1-ABC) superfamily)
MARSKMVILLLVLVAVVGASSVVTAQDETLRITLFINGTLGDYSFFDSAQRGEYYRNQHRPQHLGTRH